ncbi:MAG: hypothetical protein DMF61_07525 [Blastocatellia bacterium AA13]|nr:MAG: hypothetical protein DMF61_07525 [Blastocatellia bacterium AA13]
MGATENLVGKEVANAVRSTSPLRGPSQRDGGNETPMTTSTRLILFLTLAVGLVIGVINYTGLRRREAALQATMRSELLAHAYTLQIALEDLFKADRSGDASRLVDRLSENPYLFRVILFDENARVLMYSDQDSLGEQSYQPEVLSALSSGERVEYTHLIAGQEYLSLILPVQLGSGRRGAFEIAQPTASLLADIARTRLDHAINLSVVVIVIFLIVTFVLRRSLGRPIKALLEGAAAIGRGDLSYRVSLATKTGEFAQLANEFNRMADSLSAQNAAALQASEQRLKLERELQHRDRLVMIGRISASVAHEMGTPLNVIDARAARLMHTPDLPLEVRQRNLTIIREQSRRIGRVVRQLLDLSRTNGIRRQPVDLNEVFSDVGELIEPQARRNRVSVEIERTPLFYIDGDKDMLHQVFLNLCINSIQAMPRGGLLRLNCRPGVVERDGVEFAVAQVLDTGPGIEPEHLEHIFDPFFTTKDVGQGTGLGLAVSRRIVEDHRGWIEAANNESEPGAIFTVFLPCSQELAITVSDELLAPVDQEVG